MSLLPAWLIQKKKSVLHLKAKLILNYLWEREATKKNLKRLNSLVKSQQKLRGKRKQVVKELARDHPEIEKPEVKKTPSQLNFESQVEGLHATISSIVVPESIADKRRRTEMFNSVRSLDDLNLVLEKKGCNLSRTANYYRLLPANVRYKDGKSSCEALPSSE